MKKNNKKKRNIKLVRGVSCALWWKDWAVFIDVKVAFA